MSASLTLQQTWQSQAPANMMILGEHSVVYGHPALACALNQYVTIDWQARSDTAINFYSALGEHHTQLEHISHHPKLNFAVAALQAFQKKLQFGLDVTIHSDFSSTIGLGSSAAVLAAMLSGLNEICKTDYDLTKLFEIGHKIIIDIQGRGSGTDLAASLAGGLIFFQPKTEIQPFPIIQKMEIVLPLILIYAGYKTPTAKVLELVAENWQDKPHELEMLYRSMAKVTKQGFHALENQELDAFYQACADYQALMANLGVNDKTLQKIIDTLYQCGSVKTAKISGSGLGDCILGIGDLEDCEADTQKTLNLFQSIAIEITLQGAKTAIIT
ncbi:mevalonate kinase [Thiomicrorhabdus immobilis]|uniref:Mevalonate kinase n=1 Tax=Thiomicrorhabdus immobilis TaxID=2791037 RepID=A0ABN6CXP9_9GAMM|nr:GHMP kinase [Thiomicrorhabdus immobilis]BCN93910.1 mevalonate kinase [Thiomicrorhabdus immobilis]